VQSEKQATLSMSSEKRQHWVFFSALPPFRGGIAQFSMATFVALQKVVAITGFTFKKQYPNFLFPGSSQYDPAYVGKSPFARIVSTFAPWTYLGALLQIRKEKPTVFVTSYWMSFFAPMMAFWAYFLPKKTKKIAIIHNLNPHEKRWFDSFFNRLFLHTYDGFVVLSEAVKNEVLKVQPSAKVRCIAHPPYAANKTQLDTQACRVKLGLDPNKKTLLFFGLIRSYKGLSELIAAFSLLDDSYQLCIAGEVYGSAAIYEQALAKSEHKNWKFVNAFISDEELPFYFQAADLVVLPYLSATQSGVRALAFSYQKAVLCTTVGGLAEGLEENQEGFILENTTAQPFANRIHTLFEDTEIQRVNSCLAQKNTTSDQAWIDFAAELQKFSNSL
jgi:glycosyltransferase involved in cell wall biosynthesis